MTIALCLISGLIGFIVGMIIMQQALYHGLRQDGYEVRYYKDRKPGQGRYKIWRITLTEE